MARPFRKIRAWIRQPCEISRPRPRIQFSEESVIPTFLLQLCNSALWIANIPKHDGICRTRGLACRDDFAVTDRPIILLCLDASAVDSLNAIRALLHHAAAPNGYIGVIQQLHARRLI